MKHHMPLAASLVQVALPAGTVSQDTPPNADLAPLIDALALGGVDLDPVAGFASIEAQVSTRDDLLEFFLTGPQGAGYESLFSTDADVTMLNAALLALGAEPGLNARWIPRAGADPVEGDQPAGPGELGARPAGYDVLPPEGSSFFIYVGWRSLDEVYFFRAEDLVADLRGGKSLVRHRWVYLGSRMLDTNDGEVFVAAVEQNLINLAWFPEGNALLTAAAPECERQDIWVGNPWLVPEPGTDVRIFFSRDRLTSVAPMLAARLPIASE